MATPIRAPLASLLITDFYPSHSAQSTLAPSPVSLPKSIKRAAPSSPAKDRGESSRKVSRTASGRIRRRSMGHDASDSSSPARRLFQDMDTVASPSQASIHPPMGTPTSRRSSIGLALSPPLPSGLTEPDENGAVRSIHDPGFVIHADITSSSAAASTSYMGVGIGTPDSKRNTGRTLLPPPAECLPSTTPLSASPSSSAASSNSSRRYENQENIPPANCSTHTTPSSRSTKSAHWSSHSRSTTKSAPSSSGKASQSSDTVWEEENTIQGLTNGGVYVSGGAVRRNGRSKLTQELLRKSESLDSLGGKEVETSLGRDAAVADEGEGDELTPGRRSALDRHQAKKVMTEEADEA